MPLPDPILSIERKTWLKILGIKQSPLQVRLAI